MWIKLPFAEIKTYAKNFKGFNKRRDLFENFKLG